MSFRTLTQFRFLGFAHAVVALLLLPACVFFGFLLAPLLSIGPGWLFYLGCRLWRPTGKLAVLVRRTHWVGMLMAVMLMLFGVYAFQAAERSAGAGGGLLGGFAIIPLGLGLVLSVLSGVSLLMGRKLKRLDPAADPAVGASPGPHAALFL